MLLALAIASFPAFAAADAPSRYAALARGHDVGVAAVHVETGRMESFGGDRRFAMASTVKLPLAITVLRAADRGRVREDQEVVVAKADVRHGVGRQLGPGTYTVRALLEAMLKDSDNTATDALFRLVGGPAGVRAMLEEAGVSGIDVRRTEGEWFAQYRRRRRPGDTRDTATPAAMAALLVKLQTGKLLSPARTAALLAVMRGCRTGDARIRAGVPSGTEVADKTGSIDEAISDVGLVTLPDGTHVALAVYVGAGKDREKAIAQAARETWEAFVRR